jgi:hypothetical protein
MVGLCVAEVPVVALQEIVPGRPSLLTRSFQFSAG